MCEVAPMLSNLTFYLPVILAFAIVVRSTGSPVSADVLFVTFNSIALLGTAIMVNAENEVERTYFWVVFSLTVTAVIVIGALRLAWPKHPGPLRSAAITPASAGLLMLYGFAAFVSVGYFAAVGHITLVEAFRSTGPYDAATARLESYAGTTYFFPGYVNQFKNAVLPIVTTALVHHMFVKRMPGRWPVSLAMGAFAFVMVAGTGQRGAMVLSVLVLLSGLLLGRVLRGRILVGSLAAFFGLFALQTVVLQRQAADLAGTSGPLGQVLVFIEALWSRVVLENPQSGIAGFHYTETLPTAWGSEWVADLRGLLPGQRGSDLSNKIFETLYGSTRGTSPPSIWGDLHYNFGLVGSFVMTVLIAVAMVWVGFVTIATLRKDPSVTLLRVLAASGAAVTAGSWIAGSPVSLLNQGFLAYLAIFILEPRISGRHEPKTRRVRAARPAVRRVARAARAARPSTPAGGSHDPTDSLSGV